MSRGGHAIAATALVLYLLTSGARPPALAGQDAQAPDERRVIRVRNAPELVRALGSDRIISLAPGRYDLTGLYLVQNRHVEWVDEFDGPCPVLKHVSNLALVGEDEPADDPASALAGRVEIVISPAYGWVLSFDSCSGISLSGLVLGHTVPGYCLGGVLRFANCDEVGIRSCELYGSGTYGLGLERSGRFTMTDSLVRDCSYGLATIEGCEDLLFASTTFEDTGEFDLFAVQATTHLLFRDCEFSRNRGDSLFAIDAESRDIRTQSCRFLDNKVARFSSGATRPTTEGATFRGNRFSPQ